MIAETAAFEGKYEILGKIREGGMGAVYKVRHRLLDEIRVIKVIRPHLSTSPEMSERFLREARMAIRVRHPNIAQLHDFSIDPDGTAYIVMELINGLTLSDLLARTAPLPPGLALEIARGALGAIGYLHRRDLIHRDVSPDNLMMGRDEDGGPRVTLLDLGIAKSLAGSSALTSTGAFLGKPRYASPEHFGAEGLTAVGPRSDLYSLGVVLYELVTGVCPVQGRDTPSWIAGHLFRPPVGFAVSDPEGRVPADLQAVLLKVLAKDPEDRFASAEEMAAALDPIRARFPVEAGALERALGGVPNAPTAAPPSPGTTQDALDRRFAPLETPPPRPEPVSTLVLHSLEELPASEPSQAPPPEERTQVLQLSAAPDAPANRPPPRPTAGEGRIRPARRLVPVLAAFLLMALCLGVWSTVRSRGPAAPPPGPVAAAPGPVPSRPEPAPEPVVAAPSPPSPPVVESPPAVEASAPAPEPPEEPEVRAAPETRAAPRERPPAEPPPERRPRAESQPAVPAAPEPRSEPPAAQAPPEPEPAPAPQPAPVQPARTWSAPRPEYPRQARGSGIHAVIFLTVRVDTKGLVDKVEVRRALAKRGSNGKPPTAAQAQAFQDAAVEAARKTLFLPAMQDGKPVPWTAELVEDFPPE